MHDYLPQFLTLITVFGLAVLSPGPDFVLAVRNALAHGRRSGFWTAWGFAAGVLVHITYTLLGIAALIAQSILLFNVLKYLGAVYLIYMGVKALRSKGVAHDPLAGQQATRVQSLSAWLSWRSGFVTNLLNPKAALVFIALFTQIVHPGTPRPVQALFGLSCAVLCGIWFTCVAFVLTTPVIRARFLRASQWIDRFCGAAFIALGLKLAMVKR